MKVNVDAKLIDQQVDDLRRRYGKLVASEKIGDTDLVMAQFTELNDDKSVKEGGMGFRNNFRLEKDGVDLLAAKGSAPKDSNIKDVLIGVKIFKTNYINKDEIIFGYKNKFNEEGISIFYKEDTLNSDKKSLLISKIGFNSGCSYRRFKI